MKLFGASCFGVNSVSSLMMCELLLFPFVNTFHFMCLIQRYCIVRSHSTTIHSHLFSTNTPFHTSPIPPRRSTAHRVPRSQLPPLLHLILLPRSHLRLRRLHDCRIRRRHLVVVLSEVFLLSHPLSTPTRNRISFTMSCFSRSSVSQIRRVAMRGTCTFNSPRICSSRFCVPSAK